MAQIRQFTRRAARMILAALLLMAPPAPAADNRAALADFDFVAAKVAANYSGWPGKTAGREAEVEALIAGLRAEVAADPSRLRPALDRFIGWFRDGHLQLQWAGATAAPPWGQLRRPLTEAEARARLAAGPTAPVEGLWAIDDSYRLTILRQPGTDRFDAILLSSASEHWRPGEVKALLSPRADGRFDLAYGTQDRRRIDLVATLRAGGDILDTGELGVWRRLHDDPQAARRALARWPSDAFELRRLDADTLYLRLPSFADSHTQTVRRLLAEHAADLARTPHLVIDVRGNGGGSDFVYEPLLPLLITRPIIRVGVEVRVSPDNRRLRREVAALIETASPEGARTLRAESDAMEGATAPFIRREPPVRIVRLPAASPMPRRVAILVDRAASSAESFLLDARQSGKVVLMGQENSAGVLDFGEMMAMEAPSGHFRLAFATTRSLRLPDDPVDGQGIAPDVRIPTNTPDPVAYAAAHLKAACPRE